MRRSGLVRRVLGGMVAASTALHAGLVVAADPPGSAGAVLQGLVLTVPSGSQASRQPVPGASVRAVEIASGRSWLSGASGTDGAYRLDGLPAGQFAVAVETDSGVFLGDGLVGLTTGQQRRLSFSLKSERTQEEPEGGTPEGGTETPETPPPAEAPKPKPQSWWSSHPWLGGAVVVGTAIGLGVLADQLTDEDDNEERNASPSAP